MRSHRLLACAAALLGLWYSSSVHASIIVSGDITPHFSLTDTSPNAATAGNRQFFGNILGAGTSVGVLDTFVNGAVAPETNEFYNSLGGVSSTLLTGTLTAGNLAGLDLLLLPVPEDDFSASELTAIVDFVNGGGTLYLGGDGVFGAPVNSRVNSVLTALGSGMSLDNSNLDIGAQVATGSQIASHALTAGVTEFNYGATSVVSGGTALFFTQNLSPFVAVEGVAEVPEPSSLALLGFGVMGLIGIRKRRGRRTA